MPTKILLGKDKNMRIKFYEKREVSTGSYAATIVNAYTTTTSSGERFVVVLEPFTEDARYEVVHFWIKEEEAEDSPAWKFFQSLGMEEDELDCDEIIDDLTGKAVGLEIVDNVKDGKTYHNIVSIFPLDDEDDGLEDDDEDGDLEDDDDDDDLEEEEEEELPPRPSVSRRSSRRR